MHDSDGHSDDDCAGQWLSANNNFRLTDGDLFDDDYCYVKYSFKYDHTPQFRINLPQDLTDAWSYYPVNDPDGDKRVFFQVCQERQDDPDLCLKWGQYLT